MLSPLLKGKDLKTVTDAINILTCDRFDVVYNRKRITDIEYRAIIADKLLKYGKVDKNDSI